MKKTFSKEKLFDRTPRVFKRDATEVRFLLGGIGTGNFSVNSRGKFLDWEIFNWPSKNTKFPLSFFAIRTENKELEKTYIENFGIENGSAIYQLTRIPSG